jgi:hypothetical protein
MQFHILSIQLSNMLEGSLLVTPSILTCFIVTINYVFSKYLKFMKLRSTQSVFGKLLEKQISSYHNLQHHLFWILWLHFHICQHTNTAQHCHGIVLAYSSHLHHTVGCTALWNIHSHVQTHICKLWISWLLCHRHLLYINVLTT